MRPETFGIAFLLGCSAIALWTEARFPRFAPDDLRRAILRTAIAVGCVRILFPPVWAATIAKSSVFVALFAIALPCLTFLLLSTIWSIRHLQAAMRSTRR
jgi:hypothetical protein